MKKLVLLFTIFCFLIQAKAEEIHKKFEKKYENQKVSVEIFVSNNKIIVSESLLLKIAVTVPKGLKVDMPDSSDLGFSYEFSNRSHRFRPTDISEVTKKQNPDGSTLISQTYTLEPWLSNDYAIPPVLFSFYKDTEDENAENANNTSKAELLIISEGIRINVSPVPLADKKLSDLLAQAEIKNDNLAQRVRREEDKSKQEKNIEKKRSNEEKKILEDKKLPWKLIASILASCLFLWLILYYLRKKGISIFNKKKEPAHIIALRRIEKLLALNYIDRGLIKEFYYELSYILREYIGNRFSLYAINQTSEEFLVALEKNNPFEENSKKDLFAFNDTADTAKFSKNFPAKDQASLSLEFAKSFIRNTKLEEKKEGE